MIASAAIDEARANLERVISSYRMGDLTQPIAPPVLVLEPTNACNIDCVMCPSGMIHDKAMMAWDVFERIVSQASPCAKVILLYFMGEPLLHPRLVDMVRHCKDVTSAKVVLSTNATRLTAAVARDLLASGLDEIIFSLDGLSRGSYESIRRGARLDEVVANVRGFLAARGQNPHPIVTVQMIYMHGNSEEVAQFTAQWENLGCRVAISWLNTWAGQLPELAALSDHLASSPGLERSACAELWFKMTINCKGQAVLCCHDWSSRFVIGDLRESAISQVWNGEFIRSLRSSHVARRFSDNPLCAKCKEWSREEDVLVYFPGSPGPFQGRP